MLVSPTLTKAILALFFIHKDESLINFYFSSIVFTCNTLKKSILNQTNTTVSHL